MIIMSNLLLYYLTCEWSFSFLVGIFVRPSTVLHCYTIDANASMVAKRRRVAAVPYELLGKSVMMKSLGLIIGQFPILTLIHSIIHVPHLLGFTDKKQHHILAILDLQEKYSNKNSLRNAAIFQIALMGGIINLVSQIRCKTANRDHYLTCSEKKADLVMKLL